MVVTGTVAFVGFLLATFSSPAIFFIAFAAHSRADAVPSSEPANTQSPFRNFALAMPLVTVLVVSRLPCSLWPWVIDHKVLVAGVSAGLLACGAWLAFLLGKPVAPRLHRALRMGGQVLVLAGIAGLIATATIGAGCQLHSKTTEKTSNQSSFRTPPDDTPMKGMIRAAARQMAWSGVVLEDAVLALREELSSPSESASLQERAYARLAKRVEEFAASSSLLGAVVATMFAALLVVATRHGVDGWAAQSRWRRLLCAGMVGLAGIVFLPFCLSVVGVYLTQALAPTYLVSAWAAGTGLGIAITLWLVFKPTMWLAPPVQ